MGLALLLWSVSLSWLLCEANGHFESSSLLHCALDKMELSFSMPNAGATSSLKVLGKFLPSCCRTPYLDSADCMHSPKEKTL